MTGQLDITLPADNEEDAGPDPANASAMIAMLRRHYIPDETRPAGIFAPEIQAPGSSGRRADLIWLGCTAAAGNELVGHEIKISRADILNELADLTKSDPWQRYCDRWWLVIPHEGLIHGLELPDSWGVMLPPAGRRRRSATIHRPAPKLDPVAQAPALRTIATRLHWRLRDEHVRADRLSDHITRLEKRISELPTSSSPARNEQPSDDFVAAVVKALGGSWDGQTISYTHGHLTVDDVVAALRDLHGLRHRKKEAEDGLAVALNFLDRAKRLVTDTITNIQNETKKATKP